MSKKILFLLAVLPFLLLTKPNLVNAEENVSSDNSGLVTGFKYHENAVTFKFDSSSDVFSAARFTPKEGCVTSGQDKKGYFNDSIGKTQTIINDGSFCFICGRKGSKQVANWFNERTNNGKYTTFGHSAGKLNFAVKGTLEIVTYYGLESLVVDDLVLAQGHAGASNNWWCGCTNDVEEHSSSITVNAKVFNLLGHYKKDQKVTFYRDSDGASPSVVKVVF